MPVPSRRSRTSMACTLRTRTLIVLSDQGKEFPSLACPPSSRPDLLALPQPLNLESGSANGDKMHHEPVCHPLRPCPSPARPRLWSDSLRSSWLLFSIMYVWKIIWFFLKCYFKPIQYQDIRITARMSVSIQKKLNVINISIEWIVLRTVGIKYDQLPTRL